MTEQPPGANIFVNEKGAIYHSHEEFLANAKSKEQSVKLLPVALTLGGHQMIVCEGDADKQIVGETIDLVSNKENVTVFAENTDMLILLMYFWNS